MDVASILGIVLVLIAVMGGQLTTVGFSFLVVTAGTVGATLLAFSFHEVKRAFSILPSAFMNAGNDMKPTIEEIVRVANVARKEGLLAIEGQRATVKHASFRRALKFVTDGFEPAIVREILDAEITQSSREEEIAADVLDRAGRSALHAGLLGGALALMLAFSQFASIAASSATKGEGAYVPAARSGAMGLGAIAYGLTLGLLLLLPLARKLRDRARRQRAQRELIRLGVVGILEGQNPMFMQEQLQALARSA